MKNYFLLLAFPLLLWSCIGDDVLDDFVEAEIRVTNGIDSLSIDSSYQFEALFFNNVGAQEAVATEWTSSDESILSISASGLATAHTFGPVEVTASYDNGNGLVMDASNLHTAENPIVIVEPELQMRQGEIRTTSSYPMEGTFTVTEREEGGILISIDDNYLADPLLPDLFLYLSNNPNSIGNALVVADVEIYAGAHEYVLPEVGIDDFSHLLYFCRPFNVKVGDGEIIE